MADLLKDGAEVIVSRINSGSYSYSESFTAARAYVPTWDKTALAAVKVSVVPRTFVSQLEARNIKERETIDIQVAVQKSVDPFDLDECDALALLVEEIRLRLKGFNPGTTPGLTYLQAANDPIYDPQMRENRVFTSVLTLTYTAFR